MDKLYLLVAALTLCFGIHGSAMAQDLSSKRVGYSVATNIDVITDFVEVSKKQASEPGNGEQILVVNANGDPLKQISDVESFVSQGVDGIIIITDSDVGWEDVLARARATNIPVINHSGFALTGASQNIMLPWYDGGYAVGKAAADWLNAKFGGVGEVAILGQSGDSPRGQRTKGLEDGITQNSQAKVVSRIDAADSEAGATGAANALSSYPNIKVILAFNDDVGMGALRAAQEAGKNDPAQFFIGGSDGLPAALDAIRSGTVYQATFDLLFSFSSVQTMRDLEAFMRGQPVKPTRMHTGLAITPANLEQVMKAKADPFSPDSASFYRQITYYSDTVLNKGDAAPPRP